MENYGHEDEMTWDECIVWCYGLVWSGLDWMDEWMNERIGKESGGVVELVHSKLVDTR